MTRTMLRCLSCAFLRSRETMASTTASRPKFANGSERRNRRRPAACVATKPTGPTRKRISETASTGPVLSPPKANGFPSPRTWSSKTPTAMALLLRGGISKVASYRSAATRRVKGCDRSHQPLRHPKRSPQLRPLWAALQEEWRTGSICMALVVGQAVLLGVLR